MRFVLDDQSVFLPEHEISRQKIQHVQACDFVTLYRRRNSNILLFIEAKSSAPYQDEDLAHYLSSIYQQFWHSLFFYISLVLKRRRPYQDYSLPDSLQQTQNLKRAIMCVLVVREHKSEWLQPLQEALRLKMLGLKKSLFLQDIIVTNEQGAKKYGLVK